MIDAEALTRIQQSSYERAAPAVRSAWPPESAMRAEQLAGFLTEHHYCVLATVTSKRLPQARPVAFTVLGSSFWFATVAGARLRNLKRTPWVSLVVSEGDRGAHRVVVVDGPVTVHDSCGEQLLVAWEERHESRAEWAAAWFEVRPTHLFSYAAES
jgi:nitroimidazol reductase NimA-like FMN-containing flavoprotein (pyridoxamine 5'-phosphate oxidase superfamily)